MTPETSTSARHARTYQLGARALPGSRSAAEDLPAGRSFHIPDPILDTDRGATAHHADERRTGPLQGPRARGHRGGVRPARAEPSFPSTTPSSGSSMRHILVRHEQGAGHMRRGLRPRHRPPGRRHGHQRAGGDQHRHPAVRRLHGLDPAGRHHRPGAVGGHRHRCLPGVRHGRHHPLGHQAQRAGDRGGRHPPGRPGGVPHRHHRPAGPGAGRHPQGHRRPQEPPVADGLVRGRPTTR